MLTSLPAIRRTHLRRPRDRAGRLDADRLSERIPIFVER